MRTYSSDNGARLSIVARDNIRATPAWCPMISAPVTRPEAAQILRHARAAGVRLRRAGAAVLCLAHVPAALAHAGHGAPVHWHAAELVALALVAIVGGAAACWAIAAHEARRT